MNLPPDHIELTNEREIVANMEDVIRFLQDSQSDLRSWKWVVYALFSAIQSGLILARGPNAVVVKKKPTGAWNDARSVKYFAELYAELKEDANWEGGVVPAGNAASRWDQGIKTLKGVRDDFEHPRFDGTVYPCLMIRRGCLNSLEYFEFLVGRSQRLQKMVGHDLARLMALISQARSLIESDRMNKVTNQSRLRISGSVTPAADAAGALPSEAASP